MIIRRAGQRVIGFFRTKYILSQILFLLFVFLKPFYRNVSGSAQISDFVLILSFALLIVSAKGKLEIETEDRYLYGFLLCTIAINSICAMIYRDSSFVLSSMYYFYNAVVVFVLCKLKNNRRFLGALCGVLVINLILQVLVLFSGRGRYYYDVRFMGTFNDPNQFSFFVFSSFLLISILLLHLNGWNPILLRIGHIIVFLVSMYLILKGSSTGMLLGIGTYVFSVILQSLYKVNTPFSVLIKAICIIILIIVFVYALMLEAGVNLQESYDDSELYIVDRLLAKFNRIDSGGVSAILEERAIDKAIDNAEYLFLGAGEGYYARFGSGNEIHSTFIGIHFYYGIFPFMLLVMWIKSKLQAADAVFVPICLALLVESFTLANQRQPFFWMIIILCSLSVNKKDTGTKLLVRL